MKAARPWQVPSGMDGTARRGTGIPAGFVALVCIAAAAGVFTLIFRISNASLFAPDRIASITLPQPADTPTGASMPGAASAANVLVSASPSFVGLSSNAPAAVAGAALNEALSPAPAMLSAPNVPPIIAGSRKTLVLRLDPGRWRNAEEIGSP